VARQIVAKIGDTPFASLADAIEAMLPGDEIVVVAESVLTVGEYEMTVTDGQLTLAMGEDRLEFKDGTDATIAWPTAEAAKDVIVVSGGKYSSDPTAFLADGLEAKQKDTMWVVGVKVVIAVDDTKPEAEQNVETIVTTDDQTSTVDEEKVTEVIEQAIPTTGNETAEEKQAKQELVQNINTNTKVEGVKLTTVDEKVVDAQTQAEEIVKTNGVKAVVLAAKAAAQETAQEAAGKSDEAKTSEEKTAEAFKAAIEQTAKDSEITVKVEVQAKLVEYKPPVAETAESKTGSIEFELKPEATVTVTVKDETPVTQKVEVTNDMIDQTQKIKVSMYAGFRPVQVLHRDDNGLLIEEFTGDQIGYDEQTGIVTVLISHFSTMILKQAAVDPLAPAGAVKIADGFYQDTDKYSTAATLYITKKEGLHTFRDLINQDNGAIDDYIAKGFYSSTADNFYTENPFKNKTVKLLCDVDEEDAVVKPIGMTSHSRADGKDKRYFYGVFDGCGHTISNLRVIDDPPTAKHRVGLFGTIARNEYPAGICNLTVSNAVVSGCNYVGGFMGGATGTGLTISNCFLKGEVHITGTAGYVGGMLGHGSVDFYECEVRVSAGSTITDGSWASAGIVGYWSGNREMRNCHAEGYTGYSPYYGVGSFAGYAEGGNVISNCTAKNTVLTGKSNTPSAMGAIVGNNGCEVAKRTVVLDCGFENVAVFANDGAVQVYGLVGSEATAGREPIVGWNLVGMLTEGGLTGGTFESLPDSYVAVGYAKVAQGTARETWKILPAVATITKDSTTIGYATFADAIAAAEEDDTIVVINYNAQTMTAPEGWAFVQNGEVWTLVRKNYVAQVVSTGAKYETVQAAIADVTADGDTVKLLADVELDAILAGGAHSITIDGDGHTFTQKAGVAPYHWFCFGAQQSPSGVGKAFELKNATIDGFTSGTYMIRTESCALTLDNVTVRNCTGTYIAVFTFANADIRNCRFENNTATDRIVDFNSNADGDGGNDVLTVENCLFKANVAGGSAILGTSEDKMATVTDCTFDSNVLNSSNNGAPLYLGDACSTCTGTFFTNNVVNYTTTSGYENRVRAAGAVFTWAYGTPKGQIVGNAFVDNRVVKQSANVLTCYAKSVYTGGYYNDDDLRDNFWETGRAPVIGQKNLESSGNDIYAEYNAKQVKASSYAVTYAQNDGRYGVTVVGCVTPVVVDDENLKRASALEMKSTSRVDDTQLSDDPSVTQEEKAELLVNISQQTEVVGVKLTTESETNQAGVVITPSGVQAVIDKAKENTEFAAALAESTLVTVKVDVVVTPVAYAKPTQETQAGTIKFNLKPTAVVSVNGAEVAPQTVDVTNDMIDKSRDIKVTVYAGFEPAQVIHLNGDQVIETFSGSGIEYDPTTGNVTVTISHFSDLLLTQMANVARVDGTDYSSLADAVAAANGKTVSLLTDVALDAALTVAEGTSVTIDFAGRKVSWADGATDAEKAKGLIVNNGTLALTDGSDAGNGGLDAGSGVLTTVGATAVTTAISSGSYDGTFPDSTKVVVSGGSFSAAVPTQNCAPGYEAGTKGSDGRYGVAEQPATVTSVVASARDPWNGLVDIVVTLTSKATATIVVSNLSAAAAIQTSELKTMSADGSLSAFAGTVAGAETEQTLHLVWDSATAVPSTGSVTLGVAATSLAGKTTAQVAEALALVNTSPRVAGTEVTVTLPAAWGVTGASTVLKVDGTAVSGDLSGSTYVWNTESVVPGEHVLKLVWNGNEYEQTFVIGELVRARWSALTIDNTRAAIAAKDIETLPLPAGWNDAADGAVTLEVLDADDNVLETQQATSGTQQWVFNTASLVPGTYKVRMSYAVGGASKSETVVYSIGELVRARWSALTIDNTRAALPAKDDETLPLPAGWQDAVDGVVQLEVLDKDGNVLDTKNVSATDTQWTLDTRSLVPGEYTVRMTYRTSVGEQIETVKYDLAVLVSANWSSLTIDNTRATLPAKDDETLPMPAAWGDVATAQVKLEVLDADGHVLDTKYVDASAAQWTLDTRSLLPGAYTVRMTYPTADGEKVADVSYEVGVLVEAEWSSLTIDNRRQTIAAKDDETLPMPANWNETADGKVKLEVLDADGNVLDTLTADASATSWTLDTRSLLPGGYTVRMTYLVNGATKIETVSYDVAVLVEADWSSLTIDNRLASIEAKDTESLALPAAWGESPDKVVLTVVDADGKVVHTETVAGTEKSWTWSTVPVLPGTYSVNMAWPGATGDTNAVYTIAMLEEGEVDLGRIDNQTGVRELATSSPVFQMKWADMTNGVLSLDGVTKSFTADANGRWEWPTNGLGYGIYTFTYVVDGVTNTAAFRVDGDLMVELEDGKLPVDKTWFEDNVASLTPGLTASAIDALLKQTTVNGAPVWQNYVLGWDPANADERLLIRLTHYDPSTGKLDAVLEGKKGDRSEFGNFVLKYVLQIGKDGKWSVSAAQATPVFETDFSPVSTQKYYKGTIILEPKD